MDPASLISDCGFTNVIFIRPRCILASVQHYTFTVKHSQDIKVALAVRDCGMCGENKASRIKEKAPEPADHRPSGRMDREPTLSILCG